MKRFLASVVSLSLLVVTPAPAAWSAVAAAVGGAAAPAAPGAQAGAVRVSGPVQLSNMGAAVSPLAGSSAFSAALTPAAMPLAVPVAAVPAAVVNAAAKAAASDAISAAVAVPAAAVPVAPIAGAPILDAQGQLAETAKTLAVSSDKGESTLARLFIGTLGRRSLDAEPAAALPSRAAAVSGLERSSSREGSVAPSVPSSPNGTPNAPRGSKLLGAAKFLGLVAIGAGAAIGLQMAAVAIAPALFAVVPAAAVWAVSGGILLFPAALYARYRLSLRDSPRLGKVKTVMDLALGAYSGALFIAAPSLVAVLTGAGLLASAVPAAGLLAGLAVRGSPFLDSVLVWGALGLTPLAVAAAATGGLALAPLLGLMALPAMTTISFFLGRLISAAETGAPFSVPGSLQKIRFPAFQWVMTGVVFALLTGYSAVHTNLAFIVWNILGMRSPAAWDKTQPLWKNILNKAANFDVAYLGLLAFTAATGFTSPLTFLVIAFAGERAAVWTEKLMTRFLPRSQPAPSTSAAPAAAPSAQQKPSRWPQYHYWIKTGAFLSAMAGIGVIMGFTVFGFTSLFKSMIPAALLAFIPFFFAHKIIKALMKSVPADEAADPEFFSIMRDLRERINAERRAAGKKEIPMPEMVIDPLPVPNAYATGRSPFKALVGVTAAIKEMTLDAESVRAGVARLLSGVPADSKAFRVFRLAVAGSVRGVSLDATPTEVQSAVLKADRAELKALGVRMLRGVLGHEFSHVMDRHMLSGSVAGAISASIAFASYGIMWAVGHAQIAVKKAFDRMLSRPSEPARDGKKMVEPISIGVAGKSLFALVKLFAALWVPVVVQIVQMASSRNNEGMADEDGALLSQDPESLALALGMLTTWRPKEGFVLPGTTLPRMAALSHLMTVNPLRQAHEAGAMPRLDAVTSAVAGKGDDFLFNLFITHPDTMVRISKLADMSEALRAAKNGGISGAPSARAESRKPGRGQAGMTRVHTLLTLAGVGLLAIGGGLVAFGPAAAVGFGAAKAAGLLTMGIGANLIGWPMSKRGDDTEDAGDGLSDPGEVWGGIAFIFGGAFAALVGAVWIAVALGLIPAVGGAAVVAGSLLSAGAGKTGKQEPGRVPKAVLKFLDAVGAVLSLPMRVAEGLTRSASKAAGLSPEASAAWLAFAGIGSALGLILLNGPVAVGVALVLLGGLFAAYSEILLREFYRREALARLSSEVDAHRAGILSIPGVVSISAISGLKLYVQVQVTSLDSGNVDRIPKMLGSFPVEVVIAKAPDAKQPPRP